MFGAITVHLRVTYPDVLCAWKAFRGPIVAILATPVVSSLKLELGTERSEQRSRREYDTWTMEACHLPHEIRALQSAMSTLFLAKRYSLTRIITSALVEYDSVSM
jgi:hypothetical protein